VEDVITGAVTQAGEQGANIGRLAVLLAGFPKEVPAVTLNRMCGSSQQAVHFAAQAIAAGDMNYVIASGVESMTRVPMFSDIGGGFEKLNPELLTSCDLIHQGESAERIADHWHLGRDEVDALAAESHRRAAQAAREDRHREILPTPGFSGEGSALSLTRDEGIREVIDRAKMASLAPAFRPAGKGVVTAANSSQISDGAAALLLGNREVAVAEGLRPRARFRARVVVGDDPTLQLTGVIPATHKVLERARLSIRDLDWIEINEAFATVVLAWARVFKPEMNKVNPWGGAIAHGHPLGATGAGLMAKMLAGLEATGGRFGLQVMCIGHGMSTATIIERC
jgi:acetyl-CoA acetyltransferase family protein